MKSKPTEGKSATETTRRKWFKKVVQERGSDRGGLGGSAGFDLTGRPSAQSGSEPGGMGVEFVGLRE